MGEPIGKRIKKWRIERGLNVKELSAKIGVSPSTLKEWEYGRSIQGEPYEKIAQALEIPLAELLTGRSSTGTLLSVGRALSKVREILESVERDLLSLY